MSAINKMYLINIIKISFLKLKINIIEKDKNIEKKKGNSN